MKKVQRTGKSLTITLRGEPIAQVVPLFPEGTPPVKLGSKPGNARLRRDLAHLDFGGEWEMNR